MSSAADKDLQEVVSHWVAYAGIAGLDVSALLLAALCYFAASEPGRGLDAVTAPVTVPDHYYPH